MKIRQGFVSNSSSSSFLVVGFRIPPVEQEPLDTPLNADWVTAEREWDIWLEERRQNRDELTERLQKDTGVYEIRVIDPHAEPEADDKFVVGYDLGDGEEWHIEKGKLDPIVEIMEGLHEKFAYAERLAIISGEEPF